MKNETADKDRNLESWSNAVSFFRDGTVLNILEKVRLLRERKTIYPCDDDLFNAFKRTPFQNVKAVIVGQDPYHGKGQAHGLAFSVPENTAIPPSLRNILKEVSDDAKTDLKNRSTDLSDWADQGVLLLNTVLTVEEGMPLSHQNLGWQTVTSQVISVLSEKRDHVAFLLWGAKAQLLSTLIDSSRHLVLKAAHPSPLSAYRGFFGCRHFSITNSWLKSKGREPVIW